MGQPAAKPLSLKRRLKWRIGHPLREPGQHEPAQTPDKKVGGVSSSPQSQARQRSRTLPPQKKSSFEVRPLDLGLVALGLIVVGLIVWSSLASNNAATLRTPRPCRSKNQRRGKKLPTFRAGLPQHSTRPSRSRWR